MGGMYVCTISDTLSPHTRGRQLCLWCLLHCVRGGGPAIAWHPVAECVTVSQTQGGVSAVQLQVRPFLAAQHRVKPLYDLVTSNLHCPPLALQRSPEPSTQMGAFRCTSDLRSKKFTSTPTRASCLRSTTHRCGRASARN